MAPSQVLKEDPALLLRIAEMRAYARAKAAVKEAKSQDDIPDGPAVQQVLEVEASKLDLG